jgi:formylglycine-generating enzyme required for sulfatase activity
LRPAASVGLAVLAAALLTVGCESSPSFTGVCGMSKPVETPEVTGSAETAAAPIIAPFVQEVPDVAAVIEMIPVPGGTATADDGTTTEVAPFYIGSTEITWDFYDVFVFGLDDSPASGDPAPADADPADAISRPSKPYISMDRGFGHGGFPAISVSHHAAETFCKWLSLKTGRVYRLPTEAEWRHACALGGIDADVLDDHAWYRANSDFKTQAVGTLQPDALGLHDMYGNASEWCTGAGGEAVTLGGAYFEPAESLGCGARVPYTPDWNASDPQIPQSVWWLADGGFVGFRVVCDTAPDAGRGGTP